MNETRVFEIKNYRKGTTIGFIRLSGDGWTGSNESAQSILDHAQRVSKTEDDLIQYLSNHTNQALSIREVESE